MYDSYFNLKEKAFEARPHRDFLWNGESRRVVVEALCEGVYEENGFQVLIGDAGVGKTTVLQMVLDEVQEETSTLCISHVPDDLVDFYNSVLSGFGLQKDVFTRLQFMMELSKLLKEVHLNDKIALLAIDNAEGLSQEFFEELRTLIGLEKDGHRLLNLLLVGRSPLISTLGQPANRILRQKMAWHAELEPLNEIETREYIEYRLQAAGCDEPVFSEECFPLLHEYSGGQPARLNELCTTVLSEAADQNAELTPEFITLCALQRDAPEPIASQQDVAEITEATRNMNGTSERESSAQTLAEAQPVPRAEPTPSAAVAEAVSAVVGRRENREAIPLEKAERVVAVNLSEAEPEAEESEGEEGLALSGAQHHSDRWLTLALRGFVAFALCLGLYFLYDKISGPAVELQAPLDGVAQTGSSLPQSSTASSSQDVPLVIPDRPTGSLEPLRTNELKGTSSTPAGHGSIKVFPLEYIDN
jgi:type II secretory pathway predicted ATPase ExeA